MAEKESLCKEVEHLMNQYNPISLFGVYSKITIKSWFQYKLNACIQSLTVFLREASNVLIIYFTLTKFSNINGWNRNELFFLYSLLYITYAILIIFCTGLRDFDQLIINGTFDRFLLRPRGLLFQVVASNTDWFAALGHGGLGVVLFFVSANKVGIVWDGKTILYYCIAVISGTLIQVSLFLFFATMSFYIVKSQNLREVFYWNVRKFAGYPISIFNRVIQFFLMAIVPFAFVNYFPAQYFLRNRDMQNFPSVFLYLSPLIAAIMVVICYFFWKFSIKRYASSGN